MLRAHPGVRAKWRKHEQANYSNTVGGVMSPSGGQARGADVYALDHTTSSHAGERRERRASRLCCRATMAMLAARQGAPRASSCLSQSYWLEDYSLLACGGPRALLRAQLAHDSLRVVTEVRTSSWHLSCMALAAWNMRCAAGHPFES